MNDLEDLRRRAKDNKSNNVEYFLTLSFKILDRCRNLLITLSVVGFGFFQSNVTELINKTNVLSLILISVLIGIFSYVASYFSTMYESNYYSKVEKIFSSMAFPTRSEYQEMIRKEDVERTKKNNFWETISLYFLCIQVILLLQALRLAI